MQVWSLGWEDPLEEGMAIHSSILAWRIPWTEEPDTLQSMGSQRVGYDWTIMLVGYLTFVILAFCYSEVVSLFLHLFICSFTYYFIYLCVWLVLVAARGIFVMSLETFHWGNGLSRCGAWTCLLHAPWHVWLVLWSGIRHTVPALQGGFLTTGPPGKSPFIDVSKLHPLHWKACS